MAIEWNLLDDIAAAAHGELSELEKAHPPGPPEGSAPREIFVELLTISLGNLYGKTPIPGTLYDRAMLKPVMAGIDDGEISKLTGRFEDWVRLEGLVRAAEGQKSYMLNRATLSTLSTATPVGLLGEVMERIARCYSGNQATPELRRLARALGSYFLSRG